MFDVAILFAGIVITTAQNKLFAQERPSNIKQTSGLGAYQKQA